MKPLIVLLAVFAISFAYTRLFLGDCSCYTYQSGDIGMSAMLLLTAIGHFKFGEGMSRMLPPFIPYRRALVYLTGLIEIAAAAGLLVPSTRHLTAILLILFFVLVLPANIYAAIKKVDFEKGSYNGKGLQYLWFRIPLQLFFIAWVWYFALQQP